MLFSFRTASQQSTIFPRPVSPRHALADLKLMFSPDRPHRWGLLGVSVALTGIALWGFWSEFKPPKPERQIIYVESWMANRKDSDIIRQQMKDLGSYETDLEENQVHFQKFADAMGVEWRKEEAANKARRLAMMAAMQKILEKRLADALKREAATGKPPAADVTSP